MRYQALQAVIVRGDRIEKGQEVDIDPSLASSIGVLYLVPVEAVKEKQEVEAKPLSDMTRLELIEEAKRLGLPTNGTKAELLERLTLATQ